ncbi:hypothetical protein MIR68_007218 [Amoeboaphelidium protococcarum]|nr:hypothetical protein MIR68_007218 [Amoeboaphelidium protococcarum]
MDKSVQIVIDHLQSKDMPAQVLQSLEYLQYNFWRRNQQFLAGFLKLGGLTCLIDLLRNYHQNAAGQSSLKKAKFDRVIIQIHHSVHGPSVLYDAYESVIFGTAAEVFGKMLAMESSLICALVSQYPWLVRTFSDGVRCGSDMEKYGCMVALDVLVLNSTVVRSMLEEPHLIRAVCQYIADANSAKDGNHCLLSRMRWKLAAWRQSLELLTSLFIDCDFVVSSNSDTTVNKLRSDTRHFTLDYQLVDTLCSIITTVCDAAPSESDQQFGTMFSGPGLFKGSAINIGDMGSTIRTVIFLLMRLGYMDTECKAYVIRYPGLSDGIKLLAQYMQNHEHEELIKFLMFIGIGAPMAQMSVQTVMKMLNSKSATRVYKALLLLSCDTTFMLDNEQWTLAVRNEELQQRLITLAQSDCLNLDDLSQVKGLQQSVSRSITQCNGQLSAVDIIRSLSLKSLGLMCKFQTNLPRGIRRNLPAVISLCVSLVESRTAGDLLKWASLQFMANLPSKYFTDNNVSSQIYKITVQELGRVCQFKLKGRVTGALFENLKDMQWRFEYIISLVQVLLKSTVNLLDSKAWPTVLNAITSLMKFVTDTYREQDRQRDQYRQCGTEYNDVDSVCDPQILQSIVYHCLVLVNEVSQKQSVNIDVALLDQVHQFISFNNADVCKIAKEILKVQAQQPYENVQSFKIWPQSLNQQHPYDAVWKYQMSFEDDCELPRVDFQAKDYCAVKVCSNSNCCTKEIKWKQFIACKNCAGVYYCSKHCMNGHQKVHVKKCAGSNLLLPLTSTIPLESPSTLPSSKVEV